MIPVHIALGLPLYDKVDSQHCTWDIHSVNSFILKVSRVPSAIWSSPTAIASSLDAQSRLLYDVLRFGRDISGGSFVVR